MSRNARRDGAGNSAFLPGLAALSGACGLAHEVLYTRLFSSYLGDNFMVAGAMLAAVFLGMSAGAWQSRRLVSHLAAVEIVIGLSAISSALVFSRWGFEISAQLSGNLARITLLMLVLGGPAFLIGTCVPIFSELFHEEKAAKGKGFARIYALYNLGALLSVLAIEFLIFRRVGLEATIFLIGGLNLAVGIALFVLRPTAKPVAVLQSDAAGWRYMLVALFLASAASGAFQLVSLRLSFYIFGPLHENFAMVLASAILGVALGSVLAGRMNLRLAETLALTAMLILSMVVFVPAVINLWASSTEVDIGDLGETALKMALVMGLPLPVFVALGTLVPLVVRSSGNSIRPAKALAVSSLGNGVGAMAMFLVLYRYLELSQIALMLGALLLVAAFIASDSRKLTSAGLAGGVAAASLAFAGVQSWPTVDLLLGYRAIRHQDQLEFARRNYDSAVVYKAYDQNAVLVSFQDESSALVLNGYRSLSFGPRSRSELHEVIVGAIPAVFAQNHAQALVLGLGSGITAGATARVFDRVKVVEINPAMFEMPKHFERENHGLMARANADIVLEDGIVTLLHSPQKFDAIVNTVTSPQYYSASKLFTKDFYGLVKASLAIGGTYSSWFDVNIDKEGISIMLNTLEGSFASCRYFLLNQGYFNVVCSDSALIYPPQAVIQARLRDAGLDETFARFGFEGGFYDTMGALEIDLSTQYLPRASAEVSTLDFPAIEFVVGRETDASETIQLMGAAVAANIDFQRRSPFTKIDWRKNCNVISQMGGLQFTGCESE